MVTKRDEKIPYSEPVIPFFILRDRRKAGVGIHRTTEVLLNG